MPSTLEYLRHIRDEAAFLMEQVQGLHEDEFTRNGVLRRAFVRSIEIIGEAARQLPDDFKQQHADIEWRAMSGMRNVLIHGYFVVDYDIVWDIAANKIPALHDAVCQLIEAGEGSSPA